MKIVLFFASSVETVWPERVIRAAILQSFNVYKELFLD
jgi:hypothetical protein